MKVELIAELATNFGADVELGKRFIREFAAAGADTIKVQVFNARNLSLTDPQYDWFRACQLRLADYVELRNECNRVGVGFLATGYAPDDVALIKLLECHRIKIGSGEAGDYELSKVVRRAGFSKVLVSTGITPLDDSPFRGLGYYGIKVDFLGCVTRYPTPNGIAYAELANDALLSGWSDHAIGIEECKRAITAGAKIVEFHVSMEGQARPVRAFEKTFHEVKKLRAFADEDPKRFVGRWAHGRG